MLCPFLSTFLGWRCFLCRLFWSSSEALRTGVTTIFNLPFQWSRYLNFWTAAHLVIFGAFWQICWCLGFRWIHKVLGFGHDVFGSCRI
jgi:hypothetical protein